MKQLDLKGNRFYKISMGIFLKDKRYRDANLIDSFKANGWIVMNRYTEKGQGSRFTDEAKVGDYVYISLGGSLIGGIGKIRSDAVDLPNIYDLIDDYEEWMYREVEIIHQPVDSRIALKEIRRFWAPSGNSTFYPIESNVLEAANKLFFVPAYDLQVIDTSSKEIAKQPISDIIQMSLGPNIILYGPPGTGKTYRLQEIIKKYKPANRYFRNDPDYDQFVRLYKWWQLISMALLEKERVPVTQLMEHPLIVAKFRISEIKDLRARVWSTLQHNTTKKCVNVKYKGRSSSHRIFYKEGDSTWRLDNEEEFKKEFSALTDAWKEFKDPHKPEQPTNNSKFISCHQSLSYEDFIEGIKPKLDEDETEDLEEGAKLGYILKKGLFWEACNEAAKRAGYSSLADCMGSTKEDRQHKFENARKEKNIYYVFLDEINRCNVSAVFGELITLIEEDKRLGGKHEISNMTLPYSQSNFGVPGNLYIVGTMNTADRSVEALDTALRRRFDFEYMPPSAGLLVTDGIPTEIDGINLSELLTKINQRLSYLLDEDHQIGHSYLMGIQDEAGLRHTFKNKVIPLLKEYFYNDYGKILLVLGDSFVEQIRQAPVFAAPNDEDYMEKSTYKLLPIDESFDIIGALQKTVGKAI